MLRQSVFCMTVLVGSAQSAFPRARRLTARGVHPDLAVAPRPVSPWALPSRQEFIADRVVREILPDLTAFPDRRDSSQERYGNLRSLAVQAPREFEPKRTYRAGIIWELAGTGMTLSDLERKLWPTGSEVEIELENRTPVSATVSGLVENGMVKLNAADGALYVFDAATSTLFPADASWKIDEETPAEKVLTLCLRRAKHPSAPEAGT